MRRSQTGARGRSVAAATIACMLVSAAPPVRAASEHRGQVAFGTVPVPGATITASQGDKQVVTSTDQEGVYRFPDLADGAWTIRVEMIGFATISTDVTVAPDSPPSTWNLKLRSFEEIARESAAGAAQSTGDSVRLKPDTTGTVTTTGAAPAAEATPSPADAAAGNPALGAADGLLVNGSVNNGAASPFAQLQAFGNNRRGGRALYTGGIAGILDNSAWDSAPFSFANQPAPKPSYDDVQVAANVGGPLRIPGLLKNGPNVFLGYQRTSDHAANTQPTLVPTPLERLGDFSQTRDPFGRPLQIVDPVTGAPFAGNVIPPDRISPQAAALLGYYPLPNIDVAGRNYQAPLVTVTRQDVLQTRITQAPFRRNQLNGTLAWQRNETSSTNIFGFTDTTRISGVDGALNWSHRLSPFFSVRARYQLTRQHTEVTPFFANRTNVSGEAGIAGNNQDAVNWGPPSLVFSSGLESLATAQTASTTNTAHWWSGEALVSRGRHNVTFGGGVHRQLYDVLSQQNARGTFTFTGAASGSDLADFLLGLSGHERHRVRQRGQVSARVRLRGLCGRRLADQRHVEPEGGRPVGIRVAHDRAIRPARQPRRRARFRRRVTGGRHRPGGFVDGHRLSRLAAAFRLAGRAAAPRRSVAAGGRLVARCPRRVRRLPQYERLPVDRSAARAAAAALDGVHHPEQRGQPADTGERVPGAGRHDSNTFAVDPDFRVGAAENWQASVQRDLPASLTVIGTYLGTRGSHLLQEFLPNTYPAGTANRCPSCPSGFVYLTSNGRSSRHAAQLELRRRLRNGFTATGRYTLSKASDDAGAFTGVTLNGSAIAQDWLNLDAEWGPSTFDQRHLFTLQAQFTTGVGVSGGTLVDGIKGTLLKGWTMTAALNAGSGLPVTPVYLAPVPGTGVTGTLRPDIVAAATAVPDGYYANPGAFAVPGAGHWGTAGRNSITGPAQFGLNTGITRTFTLGQRLNLDWRIDASNVLNRVTYTGINALVGSPQFGLPNRASTMRKVQTTMRLRF